ncbi:MAG: hypothetical protein DRJ38_10200 [Thermoprotei archaeon]|nr:MAG: hypothetical protein DRJ38_10200 [Thermoprotei archaeon]
MSIILDGIKIRKDFSGVWRIYSSILRYSRTSKVFLGIFVIKYLADIALPLLENYKILYELAGLAYILTLISLAFLAIISLIVGIYGFKLYSVGSKLSRENAEKWLVKILLVAFISLFFGAFIVTVASGIALLGILIALVKRED